MTSMIFLIGQLASGRLAVRKVVSAFTFIKRVERVSETGSPLVELYLQHQASEYRGLETNPARCVTLCVHGFILKSVLQSHFEHDDK